MVQTRGRKAKSGTGSKRDSRSPVPARANMTENEDTASEDTPSPVKTTDPVSTTKSAGRRSKKKVQSPVPVASTPESERTDIKEAQSDKTPDTISSPKKAPRHEVSSAGDTAAALSNFHYEFGGPVGAFSVIVGLPLVIYGLYFICNEEHCVTNIFTEDWQAVISSIPPINEWLSDLGFAMCTGWLIFQYILERVLPGETAFGVILSNRQRLPYTLSGHLQFWVTLGILFFGLPTIDMTSPPTIEKLSAFPLELIYDNYLQLITASIIWSTLLAIYLYVTSFRDGALLAEGGKSGNVVYDFFIGRELNPRIGDFDLKVFCELRPGLIGWVVINLGMAMKQWSNNGHVSLSMVLINIFQGFYVWDGLHSERAILTTMDVTTDGFGFMLAFGDLAWVPFIYSLQARYLVDYDPVLPVWQLGAIVSLQFLGYFIFRGANAEKDAFRRDPRDPCVAHLTYMPTTRGTKLITSGWWGLARKINYTGDWIMTLSWCLLCGFNSPVPYFQAIYFLVLLVHRAMRDDKMCQEKYGPDWDEYKKRVPYLFIPYVV